MTGTLGRRVEHDPRSRSFPFRMTQTGVLRTVLHKRHVPIFDQGNLGSCVGNAAAGCMATGPWKHRTTERTAVLLYSRATKLDAFDGTWPPVDSGTSGLAGMKAVAERKWITGYQHAFTFDDVIRALQTTPVIAGTDWYEGFDHPQADGLVSLAGGVRGGHEVCLVGCDVEKRQIRAANSWGWHFGDRGFFTWTYDTFAYLMSQQGDVTIPIL